MCALRGPGGVHSAKEIRDTASMHEALDIARTQIVLPAMSAGSCRFVYERDTICTNSAGMHDMRVSAKSMGAMSPLTTCDHS